MRDWQKESLVRRTWLETVRRAADPHKGTEIRKCLRCSSCGDVAIRIQAGNPVCRYCAEDA